MSSRGRRSQLTLALLVVVAVAMVVATLWAASTATDAFHPHNHGADGASDLQGQIEATDGLAYDVLEEPSEYATLDPNGTVAFHVASSDRPDGIDYRAVESFVDSGGTLVVFVDDAGEANRLLSFLGSEVRADTDHLVRDERRYHRGPAEPVVATNDTHPLVGDAERLTFGHTVRLEPGEATVLAGSSERSYLAEWAGARPAAADRAHGPWPVATEESLGEGRVVVVGTADVFTNGLLDETDNARFLAALPGDAELVVFDAPGTTGTPPLASVSGR